VWSARWACGIGSLPAAWGSLLLKTAQLRRLQGLRWGLVKGLPARRQPHKKRTP
jgi:hypothetical protein